MKKTLASVIVCVSLFGGTLFAGPPAYLTDTLPPNAMEAIMKALGAMQSEGAALDPKTRELIALGVAAQIPCEYCTHAHTARLQKMGASDAEIREAIAMAGMIRMFSTVLNGSNYDFDKFTEEFDSRLAAN